MNAAHRLISSGLALPAAIVIAGGAWLLPQTAVAAGSSSGSLAPLSNSSVPSSDSMVRVAAAAVRTVRLPTGDQIRLTGSASDPSVAVSSSPSRGPGREFITHRLGPDLYVIPVTSQPYLGRYLDPGLFDVTRLAAAGLTSGRIPVRVSYQGSSAPTVPGVTLTSASSGVATGYISSSAAFGQALTAQWKADSTTGWRQDGSTLFPGVTKISADLPGSATATPKYPMVTLKLKAIGPDGRPQAFGFIAVSNVDDTRKYDGFAVIENGEARISVPKGNYSAIGDDEAYDEATGITTIKVTTVNQLKVTGAGQTLTVDHRKATVQPRLTVPKPASIDNYTYSWSRFDVGGTYSSNSGYIMDSTVHFFVAPAKPATIGRVGTLLHWQLNGPGAEPSYTYAVAGYADHVSSQAEYTAKEQDFAAVRSSYYSDGTSISGGLLRYPSFSGMSEDGGWFSRFTWPSRRTEYVAALGGTAVWSDEVSVDNGDDVFAPSRSFPAGTSPTVNWLRGPRTSGIPAQSTPAPMDLGRFAPSCYACRTAKTVQVALNPNQDSVSSHAGSLYTDPDGLPVSRFRFYRNGKLISDQDDVLGGSFPASTAKATYKAELEVDRRLQQPKQSTITRTELTFGSARGTGGKLPSDWRCKLGPAATCRVLPILQARIALPTGLNGTLPDGKSSVTVSLARIQHATTSSVTSARLEFRSEGSDWSAVKLTPIGGGKYRGVIDDTGLAGATVDLRYGGTDAAGSTVRQTVLNAYTVAAAQSSPASAAQSSPATAAPASALAQPQVQHESCAAAAKGSFRCLSIWHGAPQPARGTFSAAAVAPPVKGLTPADLKAAYNLPKTGGKSQTIGIVDAYDNPKAESDLKAYRKAFKLPACTTANKCFRKVDQRGGQKYPEGDPGWGVEISLDLQAVSAACPACQILLVEADDPSFDGLGAAENTAVRLGATVVSNSYGADEFAGMGALGKKYYTHPGVPILASTGDDGFRAASFPAVLKGTWAIGGTELIPTKKGGWTEDAWAGAGSGCSAYVTKPAVQKDAHCAMRTVADVSAVADSADGFAEYDTYGLGADNGWIGVSGTSLSSPLVAAMIGLAGNSAKVVNPSYPYQHRSGFKDVVGGSNGYCGGDYLCTGVRGYDAPTGVGSPRGLKGL